MSEMLNNFHFLRPWLLLLLVLPIAFYWRYYKGTHNKSSWEKVCDKNLLDFLLIKGSSSQRKVIGYFALTGLLVAIFAAAGPCWKKKEVPTFIVDNPVMILLNLSSDMAETDVSPSRIDRAKFKINDLISGLKSSQVGLIVYSDEPFQVSPVSDARLVENLLSEIHLGIMPSNGDRLDRAIALAAEKLQNADYQYANIVVVAPDVGQGFNQALEMAEKTKKYGYDINVLQIADVTSEKLKMIADKAGGIFEKITPNDKDIIALTNKINNENNELVMSENMKSQWLDYGYYFLVVPVLICLYFFRTGIVWCLIPVLMMPKWANAGFFLNDNQEALVEFEKNNYEAAAQKFVDEKWRAAALYRQGKYDEALIYYSKSNDETSLYNQANSLAKSGKIDAAIKKYEDVLAINPKHDDAKFNLEYLKRQQQQQQKNSGAQGKNDEQKQDNENSSKQAGNSEQQDSENKPENDDNEMTSSQENQSENQEIQSEQNNANSQEMQSQQGEQQEPKEQQQEGESIEQTGDKFDEKAQARALQYRDMPENTGGLLKAFIYKE